LSHRDVANIIFAGAKNDDQGCGEHHFCIAPGMACSRTTQEQLPRKNDQHHKQE